MCITCFVLGFFVLSYYVGMLCHAMLSIFPTGWQSSSLVTTFSLKKKKCEVVKYCSLHYLYTPTGVRECYIVSLPHQKRELRNIQEK